MARSVAIRNSPTQLAYPLSLKGVLSDHWQRIDSLPCSMSCIRSPLIEPDGGTDQNQTQQWRDPLQYAIPLTDDGDTRR